MDTETLLEAPKKQTNIVTSTTKLTNLVEFSTKIKNNSVSLKKIFESGTYQRKTQLSVLNRYKKRIDAIEREQDKKSSKKSKNKKKKTELPKFKGSFFAAGSSDDPLKALGTLAAFNTIQKILNNDLAGAFAPGLVAAAALLGPGLLGMAGNAAFNRGPKVRRGFDVTGRRVSRPTQERYKSRYGDNQFKNRFGNDALKRSNKGVTAIKSTSAGGGAVKTATQGGRIAKSFGKFGASIIPGIGAVVGVADATLRSQAGDEAGAAIAGTGAALDAAAAASAATGIGLPIAGLLSIASFALDLTNLVRDLSGMSSNEEEKNKNKLKEKTKEQKDLVKPQSNLTFATTLVGYEKALTKFQKFAISFKSNSSTEEGGGSAPPPPANATETYDGPISGDQYYPLPGGSLSTRANGVPGGEYGTTRSYDGGHSGQDIGGLPVGSPVVAWKTGKIRYSGSVEAGDTILTIDHGGGIESVYKHVVPTVPAGTTVYGGQQIATLFAARAYAEHLHFEIFRGGSHKNPLDQLNSSQKIPTPLSVERAKQGKNEGGISVGSKEGYYQLLHGTEAIIPIENYHTASGGDPFKNIPQDIINYITSKSKKYQMAMSSMPPEIIQVPMPILPPQIQYVNSNSMPINIQNDAEEMLIKTLIYGALE